MWIIEICEALRWVKNLCTEPEVLDLNLELNLYLLCAPEKNFFASLSLSFILSKMGILKPTLLGCAKEYMEKHF